ncbi:putative leader peptide [Pseudonocardia sp. KRD291]|uniref:putative leader peptide n=1 Tax=Pseudonocardia sp. KRD291 TaxID=2792007 RepID=UPI0035B0FC7C
MSGPVDATITAQSQRRGLRLWCAASTVPVVDGDTLLTSREHIDLLRVASSICRA